MANNGAPVSCLQFPCYTLTFKTHVNCCNRSLPPAVVRFKRWVLPSAMTKVAILLLCLFAGACLAAGPGPGYELVEQTKPAEQSEFFGWPHIDIVIEVYSKPDPEKFFRKSFKIVLSSLADPSRKELLFEYDRDAVAILSPDGKWIVVNDRPGVGQCEPRLFHQQKGLKFTEVKSAQIWEKAIRFFSDSNHYPPRLRKHLLSGDCIVESMLWSDDSRSLLLRLRKEQTGEPVWVHNWRCIYDLTNGTISTKLQVLNRGAILPGKYLAPAH